MCSDKKKILRFLKAENLSAFFPRILDQPVSGGGEVYLQNVCFENLPYNGIFFTLCILFTSLLIG